MNILTYRQFELINEWINDPTFMNGLSPDTSKTIRDWFFSQDCHTGLDYSNLRSTLIRTRNRWIWYINAK